MNINAQPPTTPGGTYGTVKYEPTNQTLSAVNSTSVGTWTGPGDPTYQQCLDAMTGASLSYNEAHAIPYRQGLGLCIKTFGQNDAVAFVRALSPSAGSEAVTVSAIRWQDIRQ